MFDLISIGNISIDLFFKGDSLTFKDNRFQLAVGGKYFSSYFYESVGGGGANVAIGVQKHGLKTAVLGKIGNNAFKRMIIDKLENAHVSTQLCHFENDYFNISVILLSKKGERSIVHHTSPHHQIIKHDSDYHDLVKTKAVYLGNLPDVSLTERVCLLHELKQHNVITFLNLGVSDCRRKKDQIEMLLQKTDVLIINGHEFAEMVKAPYKDIHFHDDIISWYMPFLQTKLVVVTEGRSGSYAYYYGRIYHQKAIAVEEIIDTTGAGDGFTAGFISKFIKSSDIEKSLESGAHYASKILQRIGAN
jgi:fructokinase